MELKEILGKKDQVNPLNVYAQTKYQGELETLKYKNSVVVRTIFMASIGIRSKVLLKGYSRA